jgi:acetyltransferase-like isoleucine patch superfamily enzyme
VARPAPTGGRLRTLAAGVRRRLTGRGPRFATADVQVGRGVYFGRDVVFNSRRVRIGDGVVVQDRVRVDAEEFTIGDYGTIYDDCFFPGPGALRIGHNFWMGRGAVVDAMAGTTIGDNVCVGVGAQLWTHMQFGDVLYGSRFHSARPVRVGDDAWLGSGVLVAPVDVGARSLALSGAVVTHPMLADRCYAGVPAADVTDKVGPPFAVRPVAERAVMLEARLDAFARAHGDPAVRARLHVIPARGDVPPAGPDDVVFDVEARTYTKRGTALEAAVMRFLLPDAKFTPRDAPEADRG